MSPVPVFFFMFSFLSFVESDLSKEKAGPYDIVGVSLNRCEDDGTKDFTYTVKNKKSSLKSSAFSANLTIKNYEIGDNVDTVVSLDQFTNNGWKIGYFKTEIKQACTSIKKFMPEMMKQLQSHLNITDCPIPTGDYYLDNVSLDDFNLRTIPTFFYNKYRMNVDLFVKDLKIGCILVLMEVVPKRKRNKQ